jgi:hypothetical protein
MIGQATVPMVTVVATPEPDGPPSRNDDSTTARPAALGWPFMASSEKSMKKRPAPEACRMAPKMVNRMISVADTSIAEPKMPFKVM